MKYVQPLTEEEILTLSELHKHGSHSRLRSRAHRLLLSNKGYSMDDIADICDRHRNRVSFYINPWDSKGLIGIYDPHRSGRPALLTEKEQEALAGWVESTAPRGIKKVLTYVKATWNKVISEDTATRILHAHGLVWKRLRRSLKNKRDDRAFDKAKQEIVALKARHEDGEIDWFYCDESGVSLTPHVPYAWQKKGA